MKRFSKILIALIAIAGIYSFTTLSNNGKNKKPEDKEVVRSIHIALTSSTGCKFYVTGEVDFDIYPFKLNSFHGSVIINGGKQCPHGSFNFTATGDTDEEGNVTALYYNTSSTTALNLLTEPASDTQIRAAITAAMQ